MNVVHIRVDVFFLKQGFWPKYRVRVKLTYVFIVWNTNEGYMCDYTALLDFSVADW